MTLQAEVLIRLNCLQILLQSKVLPRVVGKDKMAALVILLKADTSSRGTVVQLVVLFFFFF